MSLYDTNEFPASQPLRGGTQTQSEESGQGTQLAHIHSSAGGDSRDNLGAGTFSIFVPPADPSISDQGITSRPDLAGGATTESALTESEEYRLREANRRLDVLKTFDALVAQGTAKPTAAKAVGESPVTIWRWQKKFKASGYNGLLPDTNKCGRKTVLEKLGISKDTLIEIQGLNLDTESTTAALRLFASSDRCPENLARVILDPNRCSKHALPPSLRREVGVSANLGLAHRGARALSLGGIWTPRKLDILPGDIFVSDDTTPIWAWWVPWVKCEEYPFGVKLLQGQLLPVIDVASQKVLTFALIARDKSSYRACDIWALFGHTFETIGLPRLGFQLERGSWEANIIAGQEVEYQEGEMTMSRRVGGLRQLPTDITPWHREKLGEAHPFPQTLQTWTSFLPKTKSIEAFFNRSQTLEGTLWGCLGRDQMRRPFEKAKKKFQECSRVRSKEDPRQHFLSQVEMTTRLMEMFRYLDNEPMEGEVFKGLPGQIFTQATEQYPLRKLPEDMRWLYKRSWKTLAITQGWARVRLTDDISGDRYSLFYSNPTVFARHEGEEIVVYYDQQNFEQPAQIILARTGEYLCEAQYHERKGSFLTGDKSGHDVRKQWHSATMTAYGTIAKHAPSRQLPVEIAARRAAAKENTTPETPRPAVEPVIAARIPRPVAPTARRMVPAPDPAEIERQRERLARQAGRARRLISVEE